MKRTTFVALAFAFMVTVPAFAQNYIAHHSQNTSFIQGVVGQGKPKLDGVRICTNQTK